MDHKYRQSIKENGVINMYVAGLILLFSIFFSWADPVPTDPLEPHCQSVALEKGLQEKRARTGEEVYKEVCGVCHGVDAQGTDVFPTLIDTQWVKDDYVLVQIILRGVVGEIFVKGQRYASAMPSFHEELSDKDILGVVQYLQKVNGKETALTAGDIKTIRKDYVPQGNISSQAGLEALLKQTTTPKKTSSSFWKGCVSN